MSGSYIDTIKADLKYLNAVNDAEAGSWIASPIQARFGGLLGKKVNLTHAEAAKLSLSSVGTLYGGDYQYVKANAALARGQIVAWDTLANLGVTKYAVHSTISLGMEGFLAGIALNTVSSGNYGWIQIGGLASVLYRASVTAKTLGVQVLQLTTTNTADAIADATGSYIGGGALGLKQIIGVAYETPTDGGINLVAIKSNGFFQNS